MKMTTKQKIPKLCMDLRFCQIGLLGSSLTQTRISVKANIRSKIKRIINAAMILISRKHYDFQGQQVASLLPHEIAEENDSKVIVGSDEAAPEPHELDYPRITRILRLSMSTLWTSAGSAFYW